MYLVVGCVNFENFDAHVTKSTPVGVAHTMNSYQKSTSCCPLPLWTYLFHQPLHRTFQHVLQPRHFFLCQTYDQTGWVYIWNLFKCIFQTCCDIVSDVVVGKMWHGFYHDKDQALQMFQHHGHRWLHLQYTTQTLNIDWKAKTRDGFRVRMLGNNNEKKNDDDDDNNNTRSFFFLPGSSSSWSLINGNPINNVGKTDATTFKHTCGPPMAWLKPLLDELPLPPPATMAMTTLNENKWNKWKTNNPKKQQKDQ